VRWRPVLLKNKFLSPKMVHSPGIQNVSKNYQLIVRGIDFNISINKDQLSLPGCAYATPYHNWRREMTASDYFCSCVPWAPSFNSWRSFWRLCTLWTVKIFLSVKSTFCRRPAPISLIIQRAFVNRFALIASLSNFILINRLPLLFFILKYHTKCKLYYLMLLHFQFDISWKPVQQTFNPDRPTEVDSSILQILRLIK